MSRFSTIRSNLQSEYMQHAEELLCHTSRYYAYTEQFLAKLADQPDFSMTGYHCDQLSTDQRALLVALMMAPPTQQSSQMITQIISDVIAGRDEIDEAAMMQYKRHLPDKHFALHHYFGGHGFQLDQLSSPAGPIKDLALRLLIPIEVEGERVKLPFYQLGHYLDSSNPTIRQNVLESIQHLYAGGYRLVNASAQHNWGWNRWRISIQLFQYRFTAYFQLNQPHTMDSKPI